MADVITRLKVESSEYDSKIQRAAKGLLHMEEACRKVGGTLAVLEDDERKFVQSLGSMQTVATTTRGRLNELTQAYTELSIQYKRLTDEEKNGDFGKALSASLDQLKTRINDTKAQLNDVSVELGNTKEAAGGTCSIVDELTSKFGLNIKQLAGWGAAAGAAKVAMEVLKDAFFQSESNIDEWGRTVEGAKGAYDVFLNTINSGNWSNFFSNLSTAVQGARDLYDALDRLGSVKSNNQAAIAIQQQQIAQLRLMQQQGKKVDDQLKAATERLAQLQGQAVDAGKVAGSKTIGETIRNAYNTSDGANGQLGQKTIDRVTNELLTQGQAAFDKYKSLLEKLEAQGQDVRRTSYTGSGGMSYSTKEQFFNINKLTKEQQKQYALAKAITEGETRIAEGVGIYAQAVNEGTAAAREEFKGNRYALQGAGGKGGSGKGTSPQEQAAKAVSDAQLAYEQAIKKAQMEFEAGTISDADVKKRTLAAQENLWSAYGKAFNTYADPKYKEAQDAAAAEVVKLGGELKNATEEQKKAQEAAQQLAAAEKKRAEELSKLTDAGVQAVRNNDLKSAYQVQAKALQGGMSPELAQIPVSFTYTQSNLDAFTQKLKSDLATADVGSLDFNRIMGQMADANALGNFMKEAMASGVDMAQLEEVGQSLWQKIFAEGADIPQKFWQQMFGELGEVNGKEYDVNNDGNVKEKNDNAIEEFNKGLGTLTSGLSSISSGLKSIGVDIPSEIDDLIGVMTGIGQIISGVQAIISMTQTPSQIANTAAISLNTAAIGGLIAALEINTMTSLIPGLANGGIVPSFTNGGIIPKFANGGLIGKAAGGMIIPGNSFSGDNLRLPVDGGKGFIGVNSGELILNKSQQSNLASALQDNYRGGTPSIKVEGEDMWISLNNYTQRAGYGEILTSR